MEKKVRSITASAFKTRCLALIDQVARSGVPLVITKRGTPIAQLSPVPRVARQRGSAFGFHRGMVKPVGDDDLNEPVVDPADWTADEANVRSRP
jgi:prevent-host-death family protein